MITLLMKITRLKYGLLAIPIVAIGTGTFLYNKPEPPKKSETAQVTTPESPIIVPSPVTETPAVESTPPPIATPAPIVPTPEPVETVQSLLNEQPWSDAQRSCVNVIVQLEPDFFLDVATTKKTIEALKVFSGPCVVINVYKDQIIPGYWNMVVQKVKE